MIDGLLAYRSVIPATTSGGLRLIPLAVQAGNSRKTCRTALDSSSRKHRPQRDHGHIGQDGLDTHSLVLVLSPQTIA